MYGFPFFEQFTTPDAILRFLIEEEVNESGGMTGIHGMGMLGCPCRNELTAYFALLYKDFETSRTYLKKLIDNDTGMDMYRYQKDYQQLLTADL